MSLSVVEAQHNLRNVTAEWIQRIEDADRTLRETRAYAHERIREAQQLLDRATGTPGDPE